MRSVPVVFAPESLSDLIALYDWLSGAAGSQVALGYVERIEDFCRGLSLAPKRGHLRDDIRPGLRIIGFERRVTIAFMVEDDRVVILRLFYGGRDWEALIE